MENIKLFDAHSHVNDARFDADRNEILTKMKTEGCWSIVVGTDREMSEKAVSLAQENEHIYAAIGLHPTDDVGETFSFETYDHLAGKPKVVAIGECGIDFSRVPAEKLAEEKKRQTELFEQQMAIAVSHNLPLMIHCRDAHPEVLDIFTSKKKEYGDKLCGNIHFFSEGPETAKKYFDLGFTISFTGVLTFARNYDEVVRYAPLNFILSETDAPYVAPVPYRGKRNEPLYVEEVVKAIAQIRNEEYEKVREAVVANALRVFGIR